MSRPEALSPRNPRLTELRRLLRSTSARREHRQLVVEGPRLLAEALAASWPVVEVFVEDPGAWPDATVVRPGTLDRLGDAVTSQGVLAVVGAPPLALPELLAPKPEPEPEPALREPNRPSEPAPNVIGAPAGPTVLVLVDVADPGNAGTVLRSANAAGVSAVIFAGHSVDPLSPKVVRASAGSVFRVPIATASVEDVFAWAERVGLAVWATAPAHHPDAVDLYQTDLLGGVALLLGSEAHGLDHEVLERVRPRVVAVPTVGDVESLNVAMAATVVAFELLRRRRAPSSVSAELDGKGLDAPVGAGQASGHER